MEDHQNRFIGQAVNMNFYPDGCTLNEANSGRVTYNTHPNAIGIWSISQGGEAVQVCAKL